MKLGAPGGAEERGPKAQSYAKLLAFAERVRSDIAFLRPHEMIDIQSFIWVQDSAEYED